jgi:hypothetical protein
MPIANAGASGGEWLPIPIAVFLIFLKNKYIVSKELGTNSESRTHHLCSPLYI